ncbi:MAG: OmpA family protein [Thermodesulfobacteriota bacterium]
MKRIAINLTPLLDVVLILLFTFMIKVEADQGRTLRRMTEAAALKDEQIVNLERDLARLDQEGQALAEALGLKQRELEEYRTGAETKLAALDREVQGLKGERDALSVKVLGLAGEIQNLSRSLSREQERDQDFRAEAEARRKELEQALAASAGEREALAARVKEAEARRDELAASLAGLEKEKRDLETRLAEAESRRADLAVSLQKAEEQVATLTASLGKMEAQGVTLAAQLEAGGRDLARLKEEAAARESGLVETIAALRREKEALARDTARLAREVEDLSRSLVEKELAEADWRGERAELVAALEKARAEVEAGRKEIMALEAQATLSAAEITRGLLDKGQGPESRVFLHINFEFNRAELNFQGRLQADQLGLALTDPIFQDKKFLLIGHTDVRGTDEFNQRLSERRAATVKDYLVTNFGLDPDRISTEGRGESEVLYHGETEHDHALNRRVEVRIRNQDR